MRCNAAAKGIQGDGKVTLCVSKEQFDGIVDKAGDSLVRLPSLSSNRITTVAREQKTWAICHKNQIPQPPPPACPPLTTHI